MDDLVGTAARRSSPHSYGLAVAAGGVLLLSVASGGFFPPSWRWGAAAFGAAACIAVLHQGRFAVSRAGATLLGSLIAFGCWTALSASWSLDAHASLLEAQRVLLYIAALAAFLAARRGLTRGVVVGATGVALWAIADRYLGPAPTGTFLWR